MIVKINSTRFEGTVQYECMPGYETSDPVMRMCNASGVYDVGAPNCTSKYCRV